MSDKSTPSRGARRDHRARNVQPKQHDPYVQRRKQGAALVCDRCAVVWHAGRWYWGAPPTGDVEGGLCPACRRIEDRYPAGRIHLHGVPRESIDEIHGLIANAAQREADEHPLERLMQIEDREGDLVVTTTGMHVARCIADALKRRFHGGVAVRYAPEQEYIEVDWSGKRDL